jgi:nicotinic acid phosphoribosyltransferase
LGAVGPCFEKMDIPIGILTDSYKASHFLQYPDATRMVAYGEFRRGYDGDVDDERIVWYGIRYIVERFIERRWTLEDVERADRFYGTHKAPSNSPYPYPRHLFLRFIEENDGYMPIRVQALDEGTAVLPHVPVFQITAEDAYSPLCTFFETLLVQSWYPATVATLSRRTKDIIAAAFDASVEGGRDSPLLPSRLHDFGFRGTTCLEQSVLGGVAHLLNFDGTDTLSAAYYAQFELNAGRPVGTSIPATEHSVMTAWPTERGAVENMIRKFGDGLFATVMDSYDYQNALDTVVPAVSRDVISSGGYWVLRPDSGDPTDAVLAALRAGEKAFGTTVNAKGYKVTNNVGVIQGDGIDIHTVKKILDAVLEAGFSAQNVAFGMGGGLLQKVNRDTLSMAVKLCEISYPDGTTKHVVKCPAGDASKCSLPGELAVKLVDGVPTVFPKGSVEEGEDLLRVVYDKRPVEKAHPTFDDLRKVVSSTWSALEGGKTGVDPVSARLRTVQSSLISRARRH